MNGGAWVLAVLAAALAVVDWWAVATGHRRVRSVSKPGVLAALVAVTVVAEPVDPTIRAWMVAGLVLSLAGDIFLLAEERWFAAGLAAFLAAHVAYIIGLQLADRSILGTIAGVAVVVTGGLVVGRRIVRAVAEHGPPLVAPVVAYLVVISAMVVSAVGTGAPPAIIGALLFFASDATLAWNRFVQPLACGPLAVMVTYHLGQAGLVAWTVAG